MELIFNELSVIPCAKEQPEACTAARQFIATYKEAEKHGFNRIRYEKSFDNIFIAPGFTLNDFCQSNSFKTIGGLLLGLARHPFIDDNTPEEDRFVNNNFFIKRDGLEIEVEGLGIVYLKKSVGISFNFDTFWLQTKHRLYVKGTENGEYDVISISHPQHCNEKDFLEHIDSLKPLELQRTDILPNKKNITLRDDHGKNILLAFAKKLCRSPYVVEIVNSIMHNPHDTKFIRKVTDSGLIEIVLTNTDKGLGLVLQSTGRNKRETEAIAAILEKQHKV